MTPLVFARCFPLHIHAMWNAVVKGAAKDNHFCAGHGRAYDPGIDRCPFLPCLIRGFSLSGRFCVHSLGILLPGVSL